MNYTVNTLLNFEVHISEHCNLNCKGCFHFSPLAEKSFLDVVEYENDIRRLSELFNKEAGYINLMGGEPLLNPDINNIIRITRKYFPYSKIRVVTNGILLSEMDEDFWSICKEYDIVIAVTDYPISKGVASTKEIIKKYDLDFEIHNNATLLHRKSILLSGKMNCEYNFKKCKFANNWIQLKKGKLFTCPTAAYFEHINKYFNLGVYVSERNGIDIYSIESGDELLKRLSRPIPFCRYCNTDGDVYGIKYSCSDKSRYEWIDMSFDETDIEFLKQTEVLVYGAGNLGRKVISLLCKNNIKVKNVLVSSLKENSDKIGDIPVIEVAKADESYKSKPILVAVSNSYRQSVTNVLLEYGFSFPIFLKID